MRNFTEWLRLNMRVCLSATLFIEAAIGLFPRLGEIGIPSIVGGMSTSLHLHSIALSALYFILSVWLILGIRTSIAAAMGAVLLVIPAILTSPHGAPDLAVKITLITVFSLPLIFYGGGRYSVLDTREPWMLDDGDEDSAADDDKADRASRRQSTDTEHARPARA